MTSGLLFAFLLAQSGAAQELGTGPIRERQRIGWEQDAEDAFRMGRGLAPQFMTEGEWREHQSKMRSMTAEEREQYRNQIHAQRRERAEAAGTAAPTRPGAQQNRGWSWWPFGRGRGDGVGRRGR
jgi:hypothetical protein